MKFNFDDIKEIKIEQSERSALANIVDGRGWQTLRRIVESYIMQLTHNLVNGEAVSKEARYEELDKLAGFTHYWKKVVQFVENKDTYKTDEEIKS